MAAVEALEMVDVEMRGLMPQIAGAGAPHPELPAPPAASEDTPAGDQERGGEEHGGEERGGEERGQERPRPPVPLLERGAPLAPGYHVLKHLRRGRDLDVYEVWSEDRECLCVAKTVRPDRVRDSSSRGLVLREGRALKRLSHPHIVRAYDLIERPVPVLVLETLPGATLGHLIGRYRRLPALEMATLGIHLCSAVAYLHRHGIAHLDVKPSNIIANCGVAKLLDLSIALPLGGHRRGRGTRQYMAPEQARGEPVSEATDVWGIGATLFEASTGLVPFEGHRGDRYEQLERRAVPLHTLRRRLPAAFVAAVDSCLEPEMSRRPTVRDLAAIFQSLLVAGGSKAAG